MNRHPQGFAALRPFAALVIASAFATGCQSTTTSKPDNLGPTEIGEAPAQVSVVYRGDSTLSIVLSVKVPRQTSDALDWELCCDDYTLFPFLASLEAIPPRTSEKQPRFGLAWDYLPSFALSDELQSAYLEAQQSKDPSKMRALIPRLPKFYFVWHRSK